MPKADGFAQTFAALRAILAPHATRMVVTADGPGLFALASPTMKDRAGRPLACASVQIKKNYVSYHLIPVYVNPSLLLGVPPSLRGRMQGKSCFNFTTVEPEQLKALAMLTNKGIDGFTNLALPWARAR
jgi:hypothetical protein